MTKALVLLSGGIDSTTCLAIAYRECEEVCGLSFVYGQRHVREIDAAREICGLTEIRHHISDVSGVFIGSDSLLIGSTAVPHLSYKEMQRAFGAPPTYVPQRNLIFLSIASAVALIWGYERIYIGVHLEDAHTAYPDCTLEFVKAASLAVHLGSGMKVRVCTPFEHLTKVGVVRRAVELGVPLNLTWSCYEGGEFHCGVCPTCISRIEAFKRAGVEDPTVYVHSM